MKMKLRMTPDQVFEQAKLAVRYAKNACPDVEFSPEDASRSDADFLCRVLEAVIKEGATTINIPDTVGYAVPEQFGELILNLRKRIPNSDKAVWSVHCHNDLGMAVANSLAAVRIGGARQIECTVNGLGERAGNTSLEEVVMAVRTRKDFFGLNTNIDTTQIVPASRLVSQITGFVVQPNKAVVGANAFAHEAGIHQDGMLKHHLTYEIMRPEHVGAAKTKLVLGKHSGRHAVKVRLAELGYALTDADLDKAFLRFKALADKKKTITDADLEALVADEIYQPVELWHLLGLQVACGTMGLPTATVRLRGPSGDVVTQAALGTGPVDAVYKAIDEVVQAPCELLEFTVQSITQGIDALGEVTVRVRSSGPATGAVNPQHETEGPRTLHGHGADTDIIVASAKAYLAALNKLLAQRGEAAADQADGFASHETRKTAAPKKAVKAPARVTAEEEGE